MDILDVTFNFELFEENALEAQKLFNAAVDALSEMKELWRITKDLNSFDKTEPYFKEYYKEFIADDGGELYNMGYQGVREDIKNQIIEALADFRITTRKMEEKFNFLIATMQARVEYLQNKYTVDEFYGNYKVREERNNLNIKIKKYNNVKEANLTLASKYTLQEFGFEIDGEPGLQ